ncbi:somatostatin-1-like [Heptranchias perlo]|uniref:somatostatin-1-like n=1 Tax=Heptranchias perlo TaxID=212740 RepID=UPI00355A44A4
MWSSRIQCGLTLLSIALAALSINAAPTDSRNRKTLQKSMAQDLLEDTMVQLRQMVADADSKALELDTSEVETPAEHKTPLKFQHRQLGMRERKNCKNFFWKTYTLC